MQAIKDAVKERVNKDAGGDDVWIMCPDGDESDTTCVLDGEHMWSDLNVGKTDEYITGSLMINHIHYDGTVSYYNVVLGKGDNKPYSMIVTDKGELKTE